MTKVSKHVHSVEDSVKRIKAKKNKRLLLSKTDEKLSNLKFHVYVLSCVWIKT